MNQFLQIFLTCLGTLVTALVSWLSARLITWLNSKIKDREFARYSSELAELVFNVVSEVSQTFVSNLKKEGNFTAEKQKEALNKALVSLKSKMSLKLKDWVTANFGELESYLITLIESTILAQKK